MSGDALAIYQKTLDRITRSFWMLDHETLLDSLTMPNTMRTTDAEIVLDTPDALRRAAEDFHANLRGMGAQDYLRLAVGASFDPDDPDRINGRHDTFVLRGGTPVIEPFHNEMTIVRQGDTWRGTDIRAAVRNRDCPIISPAQLRALRETQGPETEKDNDQ